MSEADLRAEIEALRREIAALRQRIADAEKTESAAEEALEEDAPGLVEQLHTLAHEIADFAEGTEKGVVNHPLTSVLGALVLGILIGRAIHR
jgi:predicted  nucleic acid-binding Zn-ribbon protein